MWLISAAPVLACIDEVRPEAARWLEDRADQSASEIRAELDVRIHGADGDPAATWQALKGHWLSTLARYEEAVEPLRAAIAGWISTGDVDAELCARHLLAYSLTRAERLNEGLAEATLARERARLNGRDESAARLTYLRLRLLLMLDLRLEEALVELEALPDPEEPLTSLIRDDTRATLLFRLGHLSAAIEAYRSVITRSIELEQAELRQSARINMALSLSRLRYKNPDSIRLETLIDTWQAVINDSKTRPRSRMLAQLALAGRVDRGRSLKLMMDCWEQGKESDQLALAAACRARQAQYLAPSDPASARKYLEEAWMQVRAYGSLRDQHRLVTPSLKVHWQLDPPDKAMAASRKMLSITEQLRDVQMYGPERARVTSYWTTKHRLVVSAAFMSMSGNGTLQSNALELIEEIRARVLRERITQSAPKNPDRQAHETARAINSVQAELLEPGLDNSEVAQLRDRLTELEERFHAQSLEEPDENTAVPDAVTLEAVQRQLADGEIVLSYFTDTRELNEDPYAPGWVQVITRDGIESIEVPGVLKLQTWSEMLAGRSDWSDAVVEGMLERIAATLVEPALETLDASVRRLIVIPDTGMETLPLAMLPVDGTRLGLRYELDQVPSAGLWLQLRDRRRSPGPALILADPDLTGIKPGQLDPDFAGALPPLPGARAEARRLAWLLGSGNARVHAGQAARESVLSQASPAAMVHFATHTLIHPAKPERSAVMLTPVRPDRDGMLQGSEIENLELDGAAVFLATCASASGAWLEGEGIISLARSFMIAGASSVVATRWPVADAHAAAFSASVYRHLINGETLSSAMRRARGQLVDAGYPPEAWAGYVLIGDGAWQPVPERSMAPALAWIAAGLLLAGFSLSRWRRA